MPSTTNNDRSGSDLFGGTGKAAGEIPRRNGYYRIAKYHHAPKSTLHRIGDRR